MYEDAYWQGRKDAATILKLLILNEKKVAPTLEQIVYDVSESTMLTYRKKD
jgi:hypothetical protein